MKLIELFEKFNADEVKIANATSRTTKSGKGAVGSRAITPRYVSTIVSKGDTVLDFGSGKYPAHTVNLRDQGHDVTAHDFGTNVSDLHDKGALNRKYDIVFASNVINVQSSEQMLANTLKQIFGASKKHVVFNYPASPRKGIMADMSAKQLLEIVERTFNVTSKRVGGTNQAPLLHFTK